MPARSTLYDAKCKPIFDFGAAPRNIVSWSPHGRFLCLAGFGNLPGVILSGLGLGVVEQYGGFVLGAEYQQATVVGLLVAVLIWRQLEMRRLRQVVQ